MAYTEVTISGFDASPPPDDGSTGVSNQVKWATIKTKLFDPLKTALETIDDRVASAVTTADTSLATLQSGVSTLATNAASLSTTMGAPSGTVMLFRQTTPPTGWSKGTTYDDYALRLVTGSASTGGSTAFTSVFAARTITTANLPSHTHNFSDGPDSLTFTSSTSFLIDCTENTTTGDAAGGSTRSTGVADTTSTVSGTYSFSVSSSSSGTGSTWDFAVQYVDTIYATKS